MKTYAVISHTRLRDNSGIIPEVERANLSKYDALLLGGDMANLSSYDDQILVHLDSIFNLSNESTLWTLGNHDYTDVQHLKKYTQKNTFYAYYDAGATFIVLDTQMDSTKIIGEQLDFFNGVLDTISESKNVIIFTHKLLWMRGDSQLESTANKISNGEIGDCSYCIQSNNFYKDLSPELIKLKQKGVGVYCIAGDIGFKVQKYEYISPSGITFLASGMNFSASENYFLELTNNGNQFTYQFKRVEDL